MTLVRTDVVMVDDDERTILYDVDDKLGPVNQRTTWKPGSSGDNQAQVRTKLEQSVDFFGGNYRNWGTMTAAQKDAANRQAQRALANVSRWLLGQFDSPGD
jgi:hypothetical protein